MYKKLVLFLILLTGVLIGCQGDEKSRELDFQGVGINWRVELGYHEEQLDNGDYEFDFDLVITYNDKLGESTIAEQMGYRLTLDDVAVFESTEEYEEAIDVSALYIKDEGVSENSLPSEAQVIIEITWDDQQESFPLGQVEIDD